MQFLIGLLSRRSFSSSFFTIQKLLFFLLFTNNLHTNFTFYNLKNTQPICFYSFSFFVLFGYILPTERRSVVRWGYFYVYNHSEWRKNNWQALQFNLHSPPPYRCNNHRLHNTTTKGPLLHYLFTNTWCATSTIVDYFGQQLNNSSTV